MRIEQPEALADCAHSSIRFGIIWTKGSCKLRVDAGGED